MHCPILQITTDYSCTQYISVNIIICFNLLTWQKKTLKLKKWWIFTSKVYSYLIVKTAEHLHRTGETDSWRAQTEPWAHQDPGERSSDPTRDWPRLAQECPGVPGGGVGWWWTVAGLGELSVTVHAWDLLKGGHDYLHYDYLLTWVWPQVSNREGKHQQKIGIKIYWAWPGPLEQDPVPPTVSLSQQEAKFP